MIGPAQGPQQIQATPKEAASSSARHVLTMEQSDRMAGPVPVWGSPRTEQERVAGALSRAMYEDENRVDALSYAAQYNTGGYDEEFGFGDLLDMVNPLQHIPVVSRLYRHITGDHIKPVSQVVGDTIYGGPAGGALSLTNVIIAHETGHDIPGNVLALAKGEGVHYRSDAIDKPEQRLEVAARNNKAGDDVSDLPGTTLAFANTRSAGRAFHHTFEAVDDRAEARSIKIASVAVEASAPVVAPVVRHGAFRSLHLND
jgi:hypothetical protein